MTSLNKQKFKKQRNKKFKTIIKNKIKFLKTEINLKTPKKNNIVCEFSKLQSSLDKALNKKIIHRNKVKKIKSLYQKKIFYLNSAENKRNI